MYFQFTVRQGFYVGESIAEFIRSSKGAKDLSSNLKEWMMEEQYTVKYEDLFDGAPVWEEILDWYGIRIDKQAVIDADSFCQFDNIKKNIKELVGLTGTPNKYLALMNRRAVIDPTDPESHKFRQGKVGGYVDYLSEDDVAYIRKHVPEAARWYEGY